MRSSEHNDEILIGLEWTLEMKQRTAICAMLSRSVHLTSSRRVSCFLREIKHFPEKPCEFFFFFLIHKALFFFVNFGFIYLFMAVLGLRFCARAFSSCSKWGPLFIALRGPLTIAASLVAEHRLQMHRLSNCGSRAQLLRGMWDLPRTRLEPVSPALAGRFSTTVPPGKPLVILC